MTREGARGKESFFLLRGCGWRQETSAYNNWRDPASRRIDHLRSSPGSYAGWRARARPRRRRARGGGGLHAWANYRVSRRGNPPGTSHDAERGKRAGNIRAVHWPIHGGTNGRAVRLRLVIEIEWAIIRGGWRRRSRQRRRAPILAPFTKTSATAWPEPRAICRIRPPSTPAVSSQRGAGPLPPGGVRS